MKRTASGDVFGALRVRPEIAQGVRAHLDAVMQDGAVPQRTKELCAVMVCGLIGSDALLVARRAVARRLGADAQTLSAIWEYARSERYSAAEKAALAAAVALTREPRALPDTVWTMLRAEYDEAQIVEILCAIGLFNDLGRFSNALRIGQ